MENDVNAAAVGAAEFVEHVDGNATVVFLNFGTGLAAGLVRDGQAEHGYSGFIGEIGHLPVDPNGFECPCGQRGCLETVASGGAVAKLWPSANPPMPDLIRKARQGDKRANDVLGKVAHGMGMSSKSPPKPMIRNVSSSAEAWRKPAMISSKSFKPN